MQLYAQAPLGATSRARSLRRSATEAEKRLWRALREKLPEARWRRQAPVDRYNADFLCFSARLIVEVDGGQHDEDAERDAARTRVMEAHGFRVIRFWNNDVLANTDGVIATIAAALSSSPSPLGEGRGPRRANGVGRVRLLPSAPPEERTSPSHRLTPAGPSLSRRGEGL